MKILPTSPQTLLAPLTPAQRQRILAALDGAQQSSARAARRWSSMVPKGAAVVVHPSTDATRAFPWRQWMLAPLVHWSRPLRPAWIRLIGKIRLRLLMRKLRRRWLMWQSPG